MSSVLTLTEPDDHNQILLGWHVSVPAGSIPYEWWNTEYRNTGLKNVYTSLDLANVKQGTQWSLAPDGNSIIAPIPGVSPQYGKTTITPAQLVGGLQLETSKAVEGFTVSLSLPVLYHTNPSTGYLPAHSVSVAIYYKPVSDLTDQWECLTPNYTISSAPSRTEIVKDISTQPTKLPLEVYKILVIRLTESHAGNFDYGDEIYVKEITEIIYSTLSYPHTALLGIKIRATDQLSGSPPTVTSLVKGIKVSVPSNLLGPYQAKAVAEARMLGVSYPAIIAAYQGVMGEMSTEKVWTDNPVWCLYDLLTNKRYGMGDYYKIAPDKEKLMQANFYLMAKYCEALVESSNENDPEGIVTDTGVAAAHVRPRFTLNIVLDQSKAASEWVGAIAAIMRASVFYSEGIFWLDIDRPKLTSQIFNMSNIKDYSQSGTSYRGIPNTYEVQWINPDASYEVDVFRLESEEFRVNTTLEERKKALMLMGVTSLDQAKALGKYALYSGMKRTKIITFKTHTGGLRSMVGDVIGVQHDVPQWGWGGKIKEVGEYIAGGYPITLSASFDYPVTATELKLQVVSKSKLPITLNVVEPAPGSEGVSTLHIFDTYTNPDNSISYYIPEVGDTYGLAMVSNPIRKFKIASLRPDADDFMEITAVEYDEQMYSQCDSTQDLGAWVSTDYSLQSTPTRTSVSGVTATTKLRQDSTGVFRVGIEVFYDTPPATSFWRGTEIHWGIVGSNTYQVASNPTNSGYFNIPEVMTDGVYQVIVCSVYSNGKQSTQDALNDMINHPYTRVEVSSYVPNELFLTGVTGLAVVNKANDGTFTGKDCMITWNKPTSIDVAVETTAGDTAEAASVDNWFKDYSVIVSDVTYASEDLEKQSPIVGASRRVVTVVVEKFTYTHEMNHQDGLIARTFQVSVVAYDKLGRASEPATIICTNPAPAAIA